MRISSVIVSGCVWMSLSVCAVGKVAAEPTALAEPEHKPSWLTPALSYDGSAAFNLHGGTRRGSAYVGNLHLKVTADGASPGWPGTSAFIDVLNIHGDHPSRLVGDAQGIINLEGQTGTQVEELWVQHNFEGNRLSVLGGLYDLNSEFYRLQSAGLFLNAAFGIGPEFAQSGVEGPSIFPRTAAGLRVVAKPLRQVVIRAAVLDGVPFVRPDGSRALFQSRDGVLGIVEVALLSRPRNAPNQGGTARDRVGRFSALAPYNDKIAVGAWRYSGKFSDLSDTAGDGQHVTRRGSSGAYLIVERLILGSPDAGAKRIAAFAMAGVADPRTNRFDSHVGGGFVVSGWNLLNNGDQFGLSATSVRTGSHAARAGLPTPGSAARTVETTFELTFLSQVFKAVALQPNLQYVVHPNADTSTRNAWVGQLRFEMAY